MNAHRDALGEPHPLKGWIGIGEQLGASGIVAISDAAADALDMAAQRLTAAHQIDIDVRRIAIAEHRQSIVQQRPPRAGLRLAVLPGARGQRGTLYCERRVSSRLSS